MRLRLAGLVALIQLLSFCSGTKKSTSLPASADEVVANIDLVKVKDDKVSVTVTPPLITSDTIAYQLPKIIPGTYAVADYGRYVDAFVATDKAGKPLPVSRIDSNTWVIQNATQLKQVSYLVNDTYDIEKAGDVFSEGGKTIFSPAGTNILADKNFMLNMAGFVGYFTNMVEKPYRIVIKHPAHLYGATSMIDSNPASDLDEFHTKRYAELVDCPIMYANPDLATFMVDSMEVQLSVYSVRNKNITAKWLEPDLRKMITAQKNFLGDLNTTKKYVVLTYVTSSAPGNATGIGALEHNASTSAVFRENMGIEDLVHVVSHEFFHTVTPLKMHSKEIQYFDFSKPEMSEHLWFYEGTTEYFAQMFQVNQGLVTENDFLDVVAATEKDAKQFNDSLSFTQMSKHVLDPKMQAQYPNVYKKGMLIGMCLDIILRDKSNGAKGLKDLMRELSKRYGPDKPFDDTELIPAITELTYPEVGDFLKQHVEQGNPIDYAQYLSRVGVDTATVPIPDPIVWIHGKTPFIKLDTIQKAVIARVPDNSNPFYNALGVKDGDKIISLNNEPLNYKDMMSVLIAGYGIKDNAPVTMTIKRDGKTMELKANAKINYTNGPGYRFKEPSKASLKEKWLKG